MQAPRTPDADRPVKEFHNLPRASDGRRAPLRSRGSFLARPEEKIGTGRALLPRGGSYDVRGVGEKNPRSDPLRQSAKNRGGGGRQKEATNSRGKVLRKRR